MEIVFAFLPWWGIISHRGKGTLFETLGRDTGEAVGKKDSSEKS